MTKLQNHLTRLFAPLLLLQALSLHAQTTQPGTPPPATVPCDTLSGNTTGVQQRLNQYNGLIYGRDCVVLSADPAEDIAQLINGMAENTVILLSSNTVPSVTTPPLVADSVTGKTPVNYLIGNEIVLKNGQLIIGAADDGFEIVISVQQSYPKEQMVRVGTPDHFQFGETKDCHISHVTFLPFEPKGLIPVTAIVLAECYNRRLVIENNIFRIPYWTAVDLNCKKPLDASNNETRTGPGLLFTNNTVIGKAIPMLVGGELTPSLGIHISLPAIKNQFRRLAIIGNTFLGKMAEAGEFILGPGTRLDVFRNIIKASNAGVTYLVLVMGGYPLQGGLAFLGHNDTDVEPPLFNLAGNQIQVTADAIIVNASLQLALACNHLQAVSPWKQLPQLFGLKAVNPLPLGAECEEPTNSSIVMPATTPYSINQIVNTWAAINNSTATACSGLANLVGQFFFESENCSIIPTPCITDRNYDAASSAPVASISAPVASISPALKPIAISGLGVIITLAILLIL
ncbi:hypothetical protein [Endozoicomonas sp. 4G]|uniref:hypothetical protein n=1 Tax=Endozoicomonas sp. 4G TaxID=2872754 RepID=UPI002078759F|nr:hypothetical protein [Endozoicomonas sp. 4G]